MIEVVVDGGVDGGELLKTSHEPEPLHGPFSSSKRKMRVLNPVVEPPARRLFFGGAKLSKSGSIGGEAIGDDLFRLSMALHEFPEEFQRGPLVSSFCDHRLQDFSFVVHGPPEVVPLAVDLHEELVDVPFPFGVGAELLNPLPSDLRGEHRAEPVPPIAHRLMAHVDAALMEQVFDIPKRQWEPNIHHHRKANDLWRRLEVAKGRGLGHARTLGRPPARLKSGFL